MKAGFPQHRYEVSAIVATLGKRQHVIKATDSDDAKARFRRAYTGLTCVSIRAREIRAE